jgi:hypothetical protein
VSTLRRIPLTRWTFERFGLTPSGIGRRFASGGAPRVLCVSLPKAGTHLLERAICLHPRLYRKLAPTITAPELRRRGGADRLFGHVAAGQVVVGHLPYADDLFDTLGVRRIAPVFMTRDPRDIAVSQVRYVVSRDDHWAHELFAVRTPHDRLRLAITGDREGGLRSLAERLQQYDGWLRPEVEVVRFEDLVGAQGGGDAGRQRETVSDLYRFLGVSDDASLLDDVCARLFSDQSPTFRKGTIGQWRESFDDELTELARELAGEEIARYGYEL